MTVDAYDLTDKVRVPLSNINMMVTPQLVECPTLLCRSTRPIIVDDDATIHLTGAGTYDFLTFFGALSTIKWLRYTNADRLFVSFETKGAAYDVVQVHADTFDWQSVETDGTDSFVKSSEVWHKHEFELVIGDTDVVNAIKLETKGAVDIRRAHYYTYVDDDAVRDVELALCTTTFKKEAYIRRNISLVRTGILDGACDGVASYDGDVSKHLTMHVVDNGRTLGESLSGGGIEIHPNDNVGGAGGFARGMICAMEQKPKATHVLLMDDDVNISPESIIRTYNLLRIVNDEYEDSFVSGAMMVMEDPDFRLEDRGFMSFGGYCEKIKPPMKMSFMHDVVRSEAFEPRSDVHAFSDTNQAYSAWWYCVIPMTQIERNGLPLPIFVRYDDVEYGMRCAPKHFMTMNGICVWHSGFFMRYNAAVEDYQTTRNMFINRFATDMAPNSDFEKVFYHKVQLELKKFNYTDAELVLEAFEDFLKGPQFIMQRGMAEQRFMDANRKREKLKAFDEIRDDCMKLGVDLDSLDVEDVTIDYPRSRKNAMLDFATFNGQRLGWLVQYTKPSSVAVIDAAGGTYQPGKMRQCDTIVAIDVHSRQGVIRKKDDARFKALWRRYNDDAKEFKKRENQLKSDYENARATMTSVEFWKKYLGLDDDGGNDKGDE